MKDINAQLYFFSGEPQGEKFDTKGDKKEEVRLAYTDNNFSIWDLTLPNFVDNTFIQRKV